MANFKRGKPRTQSYPHLRTMQQEPRWWAIVFHTRPRRRRDAALTAMVMKQIVDADDAAWSVDKKPHRYYW